jgi:hypothetical protein
MGVWNLNKRGTGGISLYGIVISLSDFVKGVGGVYLNFVKISMVRVHHSVEGSGGVPLCIRGGRGIVGSTKRDFESLIEQGLPVE